MERTEQLQVRRLLESAARIRARGAPVRRVRRRAVASAFRPLIERYGTPPLGDVVGRSGTVWCDVDALVDALAAPLDPPTTNVARASRAPSDLRQEFAELDAEIGTRRSALHATPYPSSFAVGRATAFLLYATVRLTAPVEVLETGVAQGYSSFFILHALERNGAGTLHSFDVGNRAGSLVADDERARWDVRVLRGVNLRAAFEAAVASLPVLDAFVHDSDHSYAWQRFEYGTATARIRPGGLFMSDDVDASYAFAQLCRARQWAPSILVDGRKLFGLVRV